MSNSRNRKVRIRKSDSLRAVLTDTLPYELPLLFSNEELYLAGKKDFWLKLSNDTGLKLPAGTHTVPYKYQIKKNAYEARTLSLVHPLTQLEMASFYTQYEHVITGLCQRSSFTLRAPLSVASYYVERARALPATSDKGASPIEITTDGFGKAPKIATSYFAYKKYPFLYRFYESPEFVGLEKKFRFLTRLDLSDCFNRIYTHTIAWAVKSKSHAKRHRTTKDSFEAKFDSLMQQANHGETAGIVIGPEFSRIFAELILQRIDLDIENAADRHNLRTDETYAIRRYVDDYFIFTNDEKVRDGLKAIVASCTAEYRLAINAGKTEEFTRPYITGTSIARSKIATALSDFFDIHREFLDSDQVPGKKVVKFKKQFAKQNASLKAITQIKHAIGADGSYDACANYFFGTLRRLLLSTTAKIKSSDQINDSDALTRFLLALVDLIFFFYAMTPRARQTYVVTELILNISEFAQMLSSDHAERVRRRIFSETYSLISSHATLKTDSLSLQTNRVELLNLLLGLKVLGERYALNEEKLLAFLSISKSASGTYEFPYDFDYFSAGFLIAYVSSQPQYQSLRDAILHHSIAKFTEKDCLSSAELFCLFLDLLGCPYYQTAEKIQLAKSVLNLESSRDINRRANELVTRVGSKDWFFMWRRQENLALVLRKKELRTPY